MASSKNNDSANVPQNHQTLDTPPLTPGESPQRSQLYGLTITDISRQPNQTQTRGFEFGSSDPVVFTTPTPNFEASSCESSSPVKASEIPKVTFVKYDSENSLTKTNSNHTLLRRPPPTPKPQPQPNLYSDSDPIRPTRSRRPKPLPQSDSESDSDLIGPQSQSDSDPTYIGPKRAQTPSPPLRSASDADSSLIRRSKRARVASLDLSNYRKRLHSVEFSWVGTSQIKTSQHAILPRSDFETSLQLEMAIDILQPTKRMLVINPNTSRDMTDGLVKLVHAQGASHNIKVDFYTAENGPASINDEHHAIESARYVIGDLIKSQRLADYDAFLVACYSVHPLVGFIHGELRKAGLHAHVTGIFEASIVTALSLLSVPPNGQPSKFGIVSTGKYWEKALSDGVSKFLVTDPEKGNPRFGGVATTGLSAGELHSMPQEKVNDRMKDAVKQLCAKDDVGVIILGCAGMAGLDGVVREALVEKYGERRAHGIIILDGVLCGIGMLDNLTKNVPFAGEE